VLDRCPRDPEALPELCTLVREPDVDGLLVGAEGDERDCAWFTTDVEAWCLFLERRKLRLIEESTPPNALVLSIWSRGLVWLAVGCALARRLLSSNCPRSAAVFLSKLGLGVKLSCGILPLPDSLLGLVRFSGGLAYCKISGGESLAAGEGPRPSSRATETLE